MRTYTSYSLAARKDDNNSFAHLCTQSIFCNERISSYLISTPVSQTGSLKDIFTYIDIPLKNKKKSDILTEMSKTILLIQVTAHTSQVFIGSIARHYMVNSGGIFTIFASSHQVFHFTELISSCSFLS